MDLSTKYMGLDLPHPLMAGASPLTADIDEVRKLEDAGVAAIVMHSLFEEQLVAEQMGSLEAVDSHEGSSPEAQTYLPQADWFRLGPEEYLDQIRKLKEAVGVPVLGSLNGTSFGGWLDYAAQIEQAGADGLELNVYDLPTDVTLPAAALEERTLSMLKSVKAAVKIPVAVKLSPFYSSLPNLARSLAEAGADGLVLFNRFYQPDIDVETLEVSRTLALSDSSELLLRLRWLAILSGRSHTTLAGSGGVHTAIDALKAVMSGAHAVQMVSALLKNGPAVLTTVRDELASWLEAHDYQSLAQARASMSLERAPDPHAYERANYVKILQSFRY